MVRHLVEWFPGFLEGGTGIRLAAGPSVDDDPVGAWRTTPTPCRRSSTTRHTRAGVHHPHTGEMPLDVAVDRFYTTDVFMHTWDLARATGQDDTLDPTLCAELFEGMQPIDELLRSSGQYGPRVPVADDAPAQDRLLGFIGRDPAWRP